MIWNPHYALLFETFGDFVDPNPTLNTRFDSLHPLHSFKTLPRWELHVYKFLIFRDLLTK
jgi:hypothetical protein